MTKFADMLRQMTENATAAGDSIEQAERCMQLDAELKERLANIKMYAALNPAPCRMRLAAARGSHEAKVMPLRDGDVNFPEDYRDGDELRIDWLAGAAKQVSDAMQRDYYVGVELRLCEEHEDFWLWVTW